MLRIGLGSAALIGLVACTPTSFLQSRASEDLLCPSAEIARAHPVDEPPAPAPAPRPPPSDAPGWADPPSAPSEVDLSAYPTPCG